MHFYSLHVLLASLVLYVCLLLFSHTFNFLMCRVTFFNIVREQCQHHFKQSIDKILGHLSKSGKVVDDDVRSLFFGDYINPENRVYDEITDFKELTNVMERYVEWICEFEFMQIERVLLPLAQMKL